MINTIYIPVFQKYKPLLAIHLPGLRIYLPLLLNSERVLDLLAINGLSLTKIRGQ
jgi:hypothetical protein